MPPVARRHAFGWRVLGNPAPIFPELECDADQPVAACDRADALWHRSRASQLRQRTEIATLCRRHPGTALWCLGLVLLQTAAAAASARLPCGWLALAAYAVGSLVDINLFMLCHECQHGLVWQRERWNRWLFTATSLPLFLPAHHTWWIEHGIHHRDLGAPTDFIVRRRRFFELTRKLTPLLVPYAAVMLIAQLIRSLLGLALWLVSANDRAGGPSARVLAILGDRHLVGAYRRRKLGGWAVAHAAAALAYTGLLGALYGPGAVAYLLLSQLFMTGFLHPVNFGMVLSNSHVRRQPDHPPTASYYGWWNRLTFNFGYHTEHHDLPEVPWNRLPELTRLAPERYRDCPPTLSYWGLALALVRGRG
jgi:sphingolipid delta-4 desaturase